MSLRSEEPKEQSVCESFLLTDDGDLLSSECNSITDDNKLEGKIHGSCARRGDTRVSWNEHNLSFPDCILLEEGRSTVDFDAVALTEESSAAEVRDDIFPPDLLQMALN